MFNELDEKIDIWSLGALYYELVTGKKLFNGENQLQIFKQMNELSFQKYYEFYQELIIALKADQLKDEILLSMFDPNPKNRPNIDQVINYLLTQQKKMLKSEFKACQNELEQKIELNYKLIQENEQLNNQIQQLIANSEQQQKESQEKYDKMEIESASVLKYKMNINNYDNLMEKIVQAILSKYQTYCPFLHFIQEINLINSFQVKYIQTLSYIDFIT